MDSPERLNSGKIYEFKILIQSVVCQMVTLTSGGCQVNRSGHLRVDEGGSWPILSHGDETSMRLQDGTNDA